MPTRPRRRATGPRGATPAPEPRLDDVLLPDAAAPARRDDPADDERLRADRPPHHDRGV